MSCTIIHSTRRHWDWRARKSQPNFEIRYWYDLKKITRVIREDISENIIQSISSYILKLKDIYILINAD